MNHACAGFLKARALAQPRSVGRGATPVAGASERNRDTISRLRPDLHEEDLWESLAADVRKGRTAAPVPVRDLDLSNVVLTPRFSVEQGTKVRPIDDATASGLNPAAAAVEQMRMSGLDALMDTAAYIAEQFADWGGRRHPRARQG